MTACDVDIVEKECKRQSIVNADVALKKFKAICERKNDARKKEKDEKKRKQKVFLENSLSCQKA